MKKHWIITFATIFLLVLVVPNTTKAHRSGCHSKHSCPSDSGSYVCGDTGNCSECPDNQYCENKLPRTTPYEPPTEPPPPTEEEKPIIEPEVEEPESDSEVQEKEEPAIKNITPPAPPKETSAPVKKKQEKKPASATKVVEKETSKKISEEIDRGSATTTAPATTMEVVETKVVEPAKDVTENEGLGAGALAVLALAGGGYVWYKSKKKGRKKKK